MTNKQKLAVRTIVSNYYKDSQGNPYNLTDGQCEIFSSVVNQNLKWVWVSAPTRYGKTEVLALAILYLAVFRNLKIPVVAGSFDKAERIMEYVVRHIGDHPELYQGLINLKGVTDVQKLKITASKQALRWAQGGWIYITSVESRNLIKGGEGVVGEGGDVVILEEAGLIKEKEQFSKIVRMPEGKVWGKLVMSGNCVENSVFEMAYKDPMYHKVRIDLETAVREGRYTQRELDDKKSQTTSKDWKRYYEVVFPLAGEYAYFKPKKYNYLPPKEELEYYGTVDLAVGENAKGSLVGISICAKNKQGQAFEIESIGLPIGPEETMRIIFNFPYKFTRFGVEAVMFQKYYLNTIDAKSKELGLHIPFIPIQQSRKKEERIESIEPAVNTGQVLLKGDGILWKHMQDYPDIDKLDVLDAFEMCLRIMHIVGYDPSQDQSRVSF
jgi:hypothetical protein